MSCTLNRYVRSGVNFINRVGLRHKWKQRGVDPESAQAKTFQQMMAESNKLDPELDFKVDIGYRYTRPSRKLVLSERLKVRRELRSNFSLEKAAKSRTLSAPMEGVYDEWCVTNAPFQIKDVGEYFNVFQDLFGDAYFTPVTIMEVLYRQKEVFAPVFQGNLLKPFETAEKPEVSFIGAKDALYTLVLTTPDCHLTQENAEYLHWMVGNIPENDVSKGVELCNYLQPFPPRGIGYCRYIFVLYRQEKVLDLSKYKRSPNCTNLAERTFSTLDFYRELQDVITPCGLAFFQSNWDSSLTNFFHNVLEMKEPRFEYDFPVPNIPHQKWFPAMEPFDLYMDMYKHPKELGRELLLEKLKETHPFKRPPPPLKYPHSVRLDSKNPSWLNQDLRRRRARLGKWRFM